MRFRGYLGHPYLPDEVRKGGQWYLLPLKTRWSNPLAWRVGGRRSTEGYVVISASTNQPDEVRKGGWKCYLLPLTNQMTATSACHASRRRRGTRSRELTSGSVATTDSNPPSWGLCNFYCNGLGVLSSLSSLLHGATTRRAPRCDQRRSGPWLITVTDFRPTVSVDKHKRYLALRYYIYRRVSEHVLPLLFTADH